MTASLASFTTLRLGGPAGCLHDFNDPGTWLDLANETRRHPLPPLILGAGSNIIAGDHGYPGPVIRIGNCGIQVVHAPDGQVDLHVQAGEPLDRLVGFAAASGLSGIEYLAGIPGTTGAAPVQNTGAYGQQISDTLTAVTAWDWHLNTITTIPATECQLTHRNSKLKDQHRWTILAVTLRLRHASHAAPISYQPLADTLGVPTGSRPALDEAVTAVRTDRARRGLSLPAAGPDARQAGSAFINPVVSLQQAASIKDSGGPVHTDPQGNLRASAGWLLQYIGCRPAGKITDGVCSSTTRTLTITAHGHVTSSTYLAALKHLATSVAAATGITLTIEPCTPAQLPKTPG